MLVKTLRFVSLFCAALAVGLTIAHDLEIPGKQMLDGAGWLAVQHTFYGGFAIVGGGVEVLGLISTVILLYPLRKRPRAFVLTLVAAICFAGMLIVFALGNNPLNQQIMAWMPATLPATWQQTRDAWDSFHAISSALATLALILLLIATLRDIPSSFAKVRGTPVEQDSGHNTPERATF